MADTSALNAPDGMALICAVCRWRPGEDVTTGVLEAHFETEPGHNAGSITLELAVLCPRSDQPMTFERSVGNRDVFDCEGCHRTRTVRREDSDV
jgi:hypothetical protein